MIDDRKPAARTNEVWAIDFVQINWREEIRVLTIVDTFSQFSPDIELGSARGSDLVKGWSVGRKCGYPNLILVGQGTDLDLWAYTRDVTLDFGGPKPTDNAFIESFNGKSRNRVSRGGLRGEQVCIR